MSLITPTTPYGDDGPALEPAMAVGSHNTAIKRTTPSRPVSKLIETGALARWGARSILDYGCGYGFDVSYLQGLGTYRVDGYDPHPKFNSSTKPSGRYDLLLMLYVLNVCLPGKKGLKHCVKQHSTWKLVGACSLLRARSPRLRAWREAGQYKAMDT